MGTEKLIQCPKCGLEQELSQECISCGVVFEKYQRVKANTGTTSLNTNKCTVTTEKSVISFRGVRIFILLIILFVVGMNSWITKSETTDWAEPLRVVVYPINGDKSRATANYINDLEVYPFKEIDTFISREAANYALAIQDPLNIMLGPEINTLPPAPPEGGGMLGVIWWSFKMRYWAFSFGDYEGPKPDIRIFIVYFDPKTHKQLDNSLGLEKGLIGVVNAFADNEMEEQNNVVLAHEILHTLGATDKYDLKTSHPLYPDGYADPEQEPLFPQEYAEIMAGSIAISKTEMSMPESLMYAVIGPKTAREIKWLEMQNRN